MVTVSLISPSVVKTLRLGIHGSERKEIFDEIDLLQILESTEVINAINSGFHYNKNPLKIIAFFNYLPQTKLKFAQSRILFTDLLQMISRFTN